MNIRPLLCAALLACLAPGAAAAATAVPGTSQEELRQTAPAPSLSQRVRAILNQLRPPQLEAEAKTPILGTPEVAKEQIVAYILQRNPAPKLSCTVEELVNVYFEEALREGIRPDLAIAQAILETDCFRYGGDVVPEQNNYAGIGTTGGGVKGAFFPSPRIGVRAQIQHLLGYATARLPAETIVDPRYQLLKGLPEKFGRCPNWEDLNGKWAVPGEGYAQNILRTLGYIKLAPLAPAATAVAAPAAALSLQQAPAGQPALKLPAATPAKAGAQP